MTPNCFGLVSHLLEMFAEQMQWRLQGCKQCPLHRPLLQDWTPHPPPEPNLGMEGNSSGSLMHTALIISALIVRT